MIEPMPFMGFVIIAWELLRRRHGSILAEKIGRWTPPAGLVPWCCAGLVILSCARIGLMVYRAQVEFPHGWQSSLPFFLLDLGGLQEAIDPVQSLLALIVACLESACIAVIAVGIARHQRFAGSPVLWLTVGSLALVSIFSPVLTEEDIFEYLQCGSLGFGCYAPQGLPLPSSLLYVAGHVQLHGSLYGPLWTALNSAVALIPAPTLYARVEVLRIFDMAVLLGVAAVLWRVPIPKSARVAFIVNPYLWLYFVASAHIDMEAIFFAAAALYAVQRKRDLLGAILLGCAGLIKLPYVLTGGVVLIGVRSIPRRFACWAFAALIAAAGTFLIERSLGQTVVNYGKSITQALPSHELLNAAGLLAATVVLTAFMVAWGHTLLGAMWVYPKGLSPIDLPWYFAYSLPAGLVLGAEFTVFLSLLPISATLLDRSDLYPLIRFPAIAVCAALAIDARASMKRRSLLSRA